MVFTLNMVLRYRVCSLRMVLCCGVLINIENSPVLQIVYLENGLMLQCLSRE